MHLAITSLVALASAPVALAQISGTLVAPTPPTIPTVPSPPALPNLPTIPTAPTFPTTQILPVPGWNSTAESFNSLASLYTSSAAQLTSQILYIAQKNIELSGTGGAQLSYDVQAGLASSLSIVNNVFWQTAYQAEQKVCAIVSSINEQNVESVKGNLVVAVTAEVQAIISIAITLGNTVAAVQSQITEFTNAEATVLSTLIQAIVTAATQSTGPLAKLNAGLTATGINSLNEVVQSLQTAVAVLQSAATISWTVT